MEIIIWFLSLIIFSWCYSTLFNCIVNIRSVPVAKISLLIYTIIIIGLYLISYFVLRKYFNDILICSIIAGVLGFLTAKKQ